MSVDVFDPNNLKQVPYRPLSPKCAMEWCINVLADVVYWENNPVARDNARKVVCYSRDWRNKPTNRKDQIHHWMDNHGDSPLKSAICVITEILIQNDEGYEWTERQEKDLMMAILRLQCVVGITICETLNGGIYNEMEEVIRDVKEIHFDFWQASVMLDVQQEAKKTFKIFPFRVAMHSANYVTNKLDSEGATMMYFEMLGLEIPEREQIVQSAEAIAIVAKSKILTDNPLSEEQWRILRGIAQEVENKITNEQCQQRTYTMYKKEHLQARENQERIHQFHHQRIPRFQLHRLTSY